MLVGRLPQRQRLPLSATTGEDRLKSLLPPEATRPSELTDEERELLVRVGRSHLDEKKKLLKLRILDENPALHSEVDRPDAEARFRTALWVPLIGIVLYLVLTVSPWWGFALVVPLALLAQSLRLVRNANDALLTALVARSALLAEIPINIRQAWEDDEKCKSVLDRRTGRSRPLGPAVTAPNDAERQ